LKVREGDLVTIRYDGEERVVEIKQIMDKLLVKEPDERPYLEGGHRPFLIEDDDILEVVEPVEG